MKKSRVLVTDHSVIRYLEHGLGVNVEGLRRRIGRRADKALDAGAEAVIIDGLRYVIRDGHLVAVMEKKHRRHRRRKTKA